MFELGRSHTVLCAVVYRPPKYNKNDFSDFLAEIMPKYDRVLIVGDFNIHVCCPDKPMAKDFLNNIVMRKCKCAFKWLEDKEEGQSILYIVNVR